MPNIRLCRRTKSNRNEDNRILYDIGNYKFTVSNVSKIYQDCKVDIENCDTNNLQFLYNSFHVKQNSKFAWSLSEIIMSFSETIAAIAKSGDIENIKKEVRKCRRKFFYWGDLPTYIYFINENLDCYNTSKKVDGNIEINREYYDCWIAYACYKYLLDKGNYADSQIEDDKLYRHKLDLEYAEALKLFSYNYKIDCNLRIGIDNIFHNIYSRILEYGPLSFYKKMYKELYKAFDREERRIRINNGVNSELPTLLIYSIRALSDTNAEAETDVYDEAYIPNDNNFQQLLMDTKYAIRLLDVDNEYDLEFLLPSDESDYLEHIMNYSSVYDIHQYVPEGMLFLIQEIIDAYSERLEEYYSCNSKNLRNIISRIVKNAQCDFETGIISKIPFKSVSNDERNILDLMTANHSLNGEYYIPTQWDKVYSDSEWIIKEQDAYYVIPPIISMFGVYDKIGKALDWIDFGPQIETAVLDLFKNINGLREYSGKYLFEKQVYECDAIIMGTEYALIIECKRKGISRVARGGSDANIVQDIAETYFSSQAQAYRMQRAIESLGRQIDFYPSECDISTRESQNTKFCEYKQTALFTNVKHFIRISCTGGSFWIASDGGIADHIERHIMEYNVKRKKSKVYIDEFLSEQAELLKLQCYEHKEKCIRLNRLFLSFDKLYDIVMTLLKFNKDGDALLDSIWKLTRINSKKGDSTNHLRMFFNLDKH